MPGKRRHGLFPSRVEDPAVKLKTLAHIEHRVHARILRAQTPHPHRIRGVPRIAGDRPFIIDDTDRNPVPAEATGDAQPLVIAPDDDGSDRLAHGRWTRDAYAVIR